MKIKDLKKIKALKTKEDADHIIRAAINASGTAKIVKTIISDHNLFYKIELICSKNRFLKLGKIGFFALAKQLLDISVTAMRYFSAVNESFETIEIICHIGKDTHYISTPFNFLLELEDKIISSDVISEWVKIVNYKIVGGKK